MKTALFLVLAVVAVGCGGAPSSQEVSTLAANGPLSCTIQTVNGRYLTAVGGGGRVTDVLHTDAVRPNAWERFTLVDSGDGTPNIRYGIQTKTGHYLTAMGGGGRITDVMHSNATQLLAWEKFQLHSLGNGYYAIQTINGRYLTATGGGGNINDAIHSDATVVQAWEKFYFNCTSI
jgi:hypothetical protein